MRSKVLQAVLGCTTRATRDKASLAVWACIPAPPTFIPPLALQPLRPFVRGAQAPLLVRAAILSQARCFHGTPPLRKKAKRRGAKKVDDCSGHHERRKQGFNPVRCPPVPKTCKHVEEVECPDGFGELPKHKKGKKKTKGKKSKH